ncbi:hypothetical protein CDAR_178131 [Caerostris darwini]|uniref:Uncharacterized protein n=1 Tax=Caerostris darwini TaxID=1538125 RepID=A0AAV4U0V5_9ARAC|nr:hypothetical protein CDAR_178131 [Caerostris darwini]
MAVSETSPQETWQSYFVGFLLSYISTKVSFLNEVPSPAEDSENEPTPSANLMIKICHINSIYVLKKFLKITYQRITGQQYTTRWFEFEFQEYEPDLSSVLGYLDQTTNTYEFSLIYGPPEGEPDFSDSDSFEEMEARRAWYRIEHFGQRFQSFVNIYIGWMNAHQPNNVV